MKIVRELTSYPAWRRRIRMFKDQGLKSRTDLRCLRAAGAGCAAALFLFYAPLTAQQRWMLREELRIGAVDGAGSITAVASVVQDHDGRRVYVSQPRGHGVRIFDAVSGSPLRAVGRKGGGPAEFKWVGGLSLRGDTLFVADPVQQRIVAFSADGDHLETFKVLSAVLPTTRRPPVPASITPSGHLWGRFLINVAAVAQGMITESPLVILTRTGEIVHEIATGPLQGTMAMAQFPGGLAVFPQPFRNMANLIDIAPDGSAAVIVRINEPEQNLSVTRVNHRADTVFDRTYRYRPLPVSKEARDSILAEFARTTFERAGGRAMAVAKEHVDVPELQPPVTAVVADHSGRTWLRREELRPRAVWMALDAAGRIEGSLSAPPGLVIHQAAGDMIWSVIKDEWDVPYLVRYRVVPES